MGSSKKPTLNKIKSDDQQISQTSGISAVAVQAVERVLENYFDKTLEKPPAKRKFIGISTATGAILNVDETLREIEASEKKKKEKIQAQEQRRKEREAKSKPQRKLAMIENA
mgnify:CR=1 FL=1